MAIIQYDYDLNENHQVLIDAEDNDAIPGSESTTHVYDGFDLLGPLGRLAHTERGGYVFPFLQIRGGGNH